MLSMTGYGSCAMERDGRELRMELKSVNHRYMDISFRIPRYMGFLEDEIRKRLNAKLMRGHVDVFISYRNNQEDNKQVKLDIPLVKAYITACEELRRESKLEDDLTLTYVAAIPDVMRVVEADEDQNVLQSLVMDALDVTLDNLDEMRSREGKAMLDDLNSRMNTIEAILADIKSRIPLVAEDYRKRLTQRIGELLQAHVDEGRLAMEVAIFADRTAIDEEIVRLGSHIDQMREAMVGDNNGRKLDFIVQEMNREVNTIAAKSTDALLVHLAVEAKSEIEKIREQVQNIV